MLHTNTRANTCRNTGQEIYTSRTTTDGHTCTCTQTHTHTHTVHMSSCSIFLSLCFGGSSRPPVRWFLCHTFHPELNLCSTLEESILLRLDLQVYWFETLKETMKHSGVYFALSATNKYLQRMYKIPHFWVMSLLGKLHMHSDFFCSLSHF